MSMEEMVKLMECCTSSEKKLSWVRSQIIGGGSAEFDSPFGIRPITYADSTASARSLHLIEDYIIANVLPFYGNTHTSDSYVGQHTTKMTEDAAKYIKKCLGGGKEDAILFCGSGTTGAIKRLQEILGVAIPSTLRTRVSDILRNEERWVVFIGPYEHHSNILSWQNSLVQVVEIALTHDDGSIDLEHLRAKLEYYESTNRPMLGSFSACSNVTGIVSDTRALRLCFINMVLLPALILQRGEIDGYDAIFISPHKFIGGPGSPGILLMSKKLYLLTSLPPSTCGGGTITYVNGFSEEDTIYSEKIEERENAGTPPIIQTIRTALAFWVKEYIGCKTIQQQEQSYMAIALARLRNNKNIKILGNTSSGKREAILSILVYPPTTQIRDESKPLDGRFVAKLLNDLFGIQSRGGCACAGPYAHYLLDVDKPYSLALRSLIQQGYDGVKPGWTRVSFPYYMSTEEFKFVLDAVEFIATDGHRFLSIYQFNLRSGNWTIKQKPFEELLVTRTENDFRSPSFMHDLKLIKSKDSVYDMKGEVGVDDHNINHINLAMENKYDSYLHTAKFIASLLPNCPEQGSVPEEWDVDLLFII